MSRARTSPRKTRRKYVPEDECRAISAEIHELLALRDGFGRRLWTQASLGRACGLAQQHIQRALEPEGVGPFVRDGILAVVRFSMHDLLRKHGEARKAERAPRRAPVARAAELDGTRAANPAWASVRETLRRVVAALVKDGYELAVARSAVAEAFDRDDAEGGLDLYRGARAVLERTAKRGATRAPKARKS